MRLRIHRWPRAANTLLAWVVVGCGAATQQAEQRTDEGPVTIRTLPAEQVYVLESWGIPPNDTVAQIPAREAETVILRHAPPDNTVFAELSFSPETFTGTDSVTVTVRVRPGVYGVDLAASAPIGRGARLRFKYPVHFSAPQGAIARYGSAVSFERALSIARLTEDSAWALLASERPMADNLEAPLAGPGTYLVVAPR